MMFEGRMEDLARNQDHARFFAESVPQRRGNVQGHLPASVPGQSGGKQRPRGSTRPTK